MAKTARDVMTPDPACCTADTTLDQIAKMMLQNDCGEIPIVDIADRPIGVVTDRDIVCRVVAEGKNPIAHTAGECMSQPVVTVTQDDPIDAVVAKMEMHQLRRIPVTDEQGCCTGIIAQADIARAESVAEVGELVREVSQDLGRAPR